MDTDLYQTLEKPSEETLFKDRNSKFFGYAFPVLDENDVKNCLDDLKKKHHTARHFCYAYQIGVETVRYRANDDGEPNNSAGMPIYGQLLSFGVTNVLVVSVRYFGGTKLGVGGLINAYKTSAQITLEGSEIVEKTICVSIKLKFGYDLMNKVMRIVKENNITILKQDLALDCEYVVSIRKKEVAKMIQIFETLYPFDFEVLD